MVARQKQRIRQRACFVCVAALLTTLGRAANAFVAPFPHTLSRSTQTSGLLWSDSTSSEDYIRQSGEGSSPTNKPLYPKAGDVVRYYDIDGGKSEGEVLVAKISFIQKKLGDESWLVELTELEDVGDGYFAEYPSRQRSKKKALRPLEAISPIAASYVRAENAFKIPRMLGTNLPAVRMERYDLEGYDGPFSGENAVNQQVVLQDAEIYALLKSSLLRNSAIAGVVGTLITDLVKGPQDAAIYAAGAAAGVGYLFLLSVKTDTLGSPDAKFGNNIANLRFMFPLIVVAGVALFNKSLGDANPIQSGSLFETITAEQFAAAIIGFLTYRIPLFASQIKEFLGSGSGQDAVLPGSAGVALKLVQEMEAEAVRARTSDVKEVGLTPILLVSGPPATGRSNLVNQLLSQGDGRFVLPKLVDRNRDGATFERLDQKGEFLQVDPTGRFGLTREGILTAATVGESVVVVDADVDLAKKLTRISGARLIGVWVGLDSVEKFESRLNAQVDLGEIDIPSDETRESVIRAKVKEIVKDIEYGIVSGIFEFTILNDDPSESMKQLQEAAQYCFK